MFIDKNFECFCLCGECGVEFVDDFLDRVMVVVVASVASISIAIVMGFFLVFSLSKENCWATVPIVGLESGSVSSVATVAAIASIAVATVSTVLETLDLPLGVLKKFGDSVCDGLLFGMNRGFGTFQSTSERVQ